MSEGDTEFKVSSREFDYLKQLVSHDESLAGLLGCASVARGGRVIVRVSRAEAEKLRRCLTTRLAVAGFDKDYSLTEEGRMLEELIDRFYRP